MVDEIHHCKWCKKIFIPSRQKQMFCSHRCSHYFHNRIGNHTGIEPKPDSYVKKFVCAQCGKVVYIQDEKQDKRTRFCSSQCIRRYYRHSKKKEGV